jgi:hypothetical protein
MAEIAIGVFWMLVSRRVAVMTISPCWAVVEVSVGAGSADAGGAADEGGEAEAGGAV